MGEPAKLTGSRPRPADAPAAHRRQAAGRTRRHDGRDGARRRTVRWTIRGALPLSLLLWLLSLRDVRLAAMRDLGLLQVLPLLFWVALALLAAGFVLAVTARRSGHVWPAAYVLGLIAVIHATPTLLYPTLRYSWAWKHVAVVDAMLRHGGTVPNAEELSIYNQWPGLFQFNALVLDATGLHSPLGYAAWAPAVMNVLLLGPLVLLFRSVTRDRRLIWGAAWIYYSCSWVGQDYFSPQAFAFLLFVTVTALVMRQLPSSAHRAQPADRAQPTHRPQPAAGAPGGQERWPRASLAAVLLLAAAIVISHPLTPVMLICALLALWLVRRNRRTVSPVLLGTVAMTVVWDATVARPYLSANLQSLVGDLLDPSANLVTGLNGLGATAPGQILVSWTDRGLSLVVLLLAVAAFFFRPWVRRTGMPLLVVFPLPVLVANPYGGEMVFRAYLFALPAAAFLISALIFGRGRGRDLERGRDQERGRDLERGRGARTRPRALAVYPLLLCLLGGLVFGYYGKEAMLHFTKKEVAASRFVTSTVPAGSAVVSLTSNVPGLDRNYDRHYRVPLNQQDEANRRLLLRDPLASVRTFVGTSTQDQPAYVILTRGQAVECSLTGTLPADTMQRLTAALTASADFDVVYRNDDAVVFRHPPPERGADR